MRDFNRRLTFTDNSFLRRAARPLATALLFVLVLQTIFVFRVYKQADAYLQENDPRRLQNRSETIFYFAPWQIRLGSAVSREEVIAHLNEIAYQVSDENIPASYSVSGKTVRINSRLPRLFPDAVLTFDNKRAASITVNDQPVERLLIEPLQLQNAVDYVNDDSSLKKDLRIRRIVLQPGSIPALVVDALTSAEDRRFPYHHGVNWLSATLRPILTFGKQGGSSLTQQLIKNNVVQGAKGAFWQTGIDGFDKKFSKFERKIAEPFLALKAEQMMSKDEILAAYMSMNYMGTVGGVDLQGFMAASQEFFDTSLFELSDASNPVSLSRAATLAGMVQGPAAYLKYVRNGEKCGDNEKTCLNLKNRRDAVLDLMQANFPEKYTAALVERAKAEPLGFVFASTKRRERPIEADSRIFIQYAMTEGNLPAELQRLRGEEGEVIIFTSLDPRMQKAAVEAVRDALQKLQPKIDKAYREQRALNEAKFAQVEERCRRRNAGNERACDNLFKAQASLIAIDAQTGEILAMTGTDVNSRRSPGSLIKPFFYLKAIESGSFKGAPFTAATFLDKDADLNLLSEYCAEPDNLGGSGTARQELAHSWNFGACVAAQSAGLPTDLVGRITNSKPEHKLMAVLGGTSGSEATLLDMVQAYSYFPNSGRMTRATAYKSAYQSNDSSENRIDFTRRPPQVSLDPAATFVTTQMMESVVEEGTGANFRSLANLPTTVQVAGKSGSGMIADLWWVSFTPRIVVGVWVGMGENLPELRMADGFTGGKVSAPIAAAFMRSVAQYHPELLKGQFAQPENVVVRRIDPRRGCLVNGGGAEEFFIAGREPRHCN
ncbi:MAG: transglycosylase domain-containing protein [Acidobacteriota bacterium]|nr:transglycosylase domain-containing protein [Acidobacteriota bacterium]